MPPTIPPAKNAAIIPINAAGTIIKAFSIIYILLSCELSAPMEAYFL